jgi:SAM-dependent methyltransferase
MSSSLQGTFYDEHQDYAAGSPHLKHPRLKAFLLSLIFASIENATEAGLPPEILEVGGGDGSITEPLLANGLRVTSTEMSTTSIATMEARFRRNADFRAIHDGDGSLALLGETQFSCILFASVLHHIPDYLGTISHVLDRHLRPGGSLVTIQDPLWYSRMDKTARKASSAAYLTWRVTQGGLTRGVQTRFRRATRGLSEEEPGDAIEYHVVRDGVDERAIENSLKSRFDSASVYPYWSSQGTPQQKIGDRLHLANTFALCACGYRK